MGPAARACPAGTLCSAPLVELPRVARSLFALAALVAASALVATLAWVVLTFSSRPLDGVEGDVLFEADRIRAGLPLYVDPAAGAHEYGPPPSRYLVLYPPLWSAVLSLSPAGSAHLVARAVAALAWFGLLAWIVLRAPRERRAVVGGAAAFVGGAWVLGLYGASGRPDALAILFSGLALERAARRGRLDAVAGALFALAAWTKPNVIGAAPGAIVAAALVAAPPRLRAVGGALRAGAGVSLVVGGILTDVAGRAWVAHLLASTGQPPSLSLWTEQMASRLPFFGLPMAAALALGWRGRRDPGVAIATGALASSAAWCVLSFAKIGSAANYVMEPSIAALVVLARAPLPALGPRAAIAASALAVAQAAWTGTASVRSALERIGTARARADALASARAVCGAPPGSVVLADEPGLERMMNGRAVQTPFQSTHLARRGRFPTAAWVDDVGRPEVACLVMQDDLLERSLDRVSVEHDRFGPELRRALVARFELASERGGYRMYRRRDKGGGEER